MSLFRRQAISLNKAGSFGPIEQASVNIKWKYDVLIQQNEYENMAGKIWGILPRH